MKLLPEDPRLTAYALGEIEDKQERTAIEAAVEQSPELQAVVASIRDMADLLSEGLASEPAPELSEFEKAKLEQAPKRGGSGMGRLLSWPVWTTVAAVLVVVFVMIPQRGAVKQEFAYQAEPRAVVAPQTERKDVALSETRAVEFDDVRLNAEGAKTADTLSDASKPALGSVDEFRKEHQSISKYVMVPRAKEAPEIAVIMKPQASPVRTQSSRVMKRLIPLRARASPRDAREVKVQARGSIAPPIGPPQATWNTEKYAPIEETDFRSPLVAPLSTFSIDVDTASYANVRRFLNQGQLPPADAVRIEELINYFPYSDAAPTGSLDAGGAPFAVHMAQTVAPWNESNRLLRVALKGYEMPWDERPASNLVFLLDVSGSMNNANKLPLVKDAMDLLVRRLDGRDRVAIVVYAGASGLALPSTTANNRETIQHAMENLKAGGSTNGGAGIQLAYKVAREHFIEGGNNRVILCTDGDFNIGQTNQGDLADVAEAAVDEGVSLTILGFGMGNYKDDLLEELSNKGKGSYAYVDSSAEARKVFLEDLASNIFKIAKDVKIQVEFNPAQVQAYRLIGYENRRLKAEDFNNDKKKAGDIGPGHTVVALYEIVPSNVDGELPDVDALRYQQSVETEAVPGEVATVKLRYKQPEANVSQLITRTVESDDLMAFDAASEDVRFSAIVAAFGMRLSGSEHVRGLTYDVIESIAASALGIDPGGHRSEFVGLVRQARELSSKNAPTPVPCRGAGE
jgi:Ca-activated chloride channel family protein